MFCCFLLESLIPKTFVDSLTRGAGGLSSIVKDSLGEIYQAITINKIIIDNSIPFLPEEIIINILKRLPVKSLIRFQCVCKHWKYLVKNPSFIADHLHHSTYQNPCLLFQPYISRGPLKLHLLDCETQVRRVPNHPLIDYLKCSYVVGSSNGLLCVSIRKYCISHHSLLLCNPAIREVRQVPKAIDAFEGRYSRIGFGFSPIVNDFKIVRIYANWWSDVVVENVEVYSLRTGSSWKGVELGILDGVSICSAGFNANGAIFWFGFKLKERNGVGDFVRRNGHDVIMSFDIAMEVFTLIPMPASAPRSHPNRLTTHENKLAMLSPHVIGNSQSLIDLLMIEEGAVASGERLSWTKKYTSNLYPCFLHPMTIWRNAIVYSVSTGQEMENDKPNTVLLNLTTKEFTEFAVSRSRYGHHIFNYVESLIPVGGMKLSAMFA